jgi:hypothetical protein
MLMLLMLMLMLMATSGRHVLGLVLWRWLVLVLGSFLGLAAIRQRAPLQASASSMERSEPPPAAG